MTTGNVEECCADEVSRTRRLEQLTCEVNSKCGTLRAASRLLPGLSALDSQEMLRLMADEALRLAKSLEEHRCEAAES